MDQLPADSPVRYGCYAGLVIAGLVLLYTLELIFTGSHHLVSYKAAFLVGGLVQGVTCWYTLQGSRAAWSFATALNGVLAFAFVFGAPTFRDRWDISLLLGFVPAVVLAAVTVLLVWPQAAEPRD